MTVKIQTKVLAAACAALILFGCSSPPPAKDAEAEKKASPPAETSTGSEAAKAPEAKGSTAPETFRVKFTSSKGPFVVEVHKAWAPKGAQRFYDLVQAGYYDGNRFFRIVKGFVVQFGMAADPALTRKWDNNIPDDPVMQTNRTGSVTFATAGPNTRTTQLFINLASNQFLDSKGFAPFGMVVEGMSVVESLNKEYGERPDQDAIRQRGNAYLNAEFPNLDYIKKAEIVPGA